VLLGESAVLSTMSRLRAQISNPVSGLTGSVRTLNDLGIATQKDGTLTFDSSKLSKAYASDRNSVAALFAVMGRPSDSASIYVSSSKETVAGTYAVNITQAASQAVFTGDTLTGTFPISVDSSNDTLKVKVNGVESGMISLTQGSYASGTELAAELQSRFNGDSDLKSGGAAVKVSFINNQFQIQSTLYGSTSKVEITQVNTNTFSTLGLRTGLGTSGTDVAGTIDGEEATGNGQVLTANTGNSKGLSVLMDGTQTGSRGTVNFTRGLMEQLSNLLTSSLDTTGTLAIRAKGLNTSISDITRQRTDLSKRMDTYQTQLYTKFNAMDSIVGKLQATSSYLTQQISALNSASSQK
ncbi:MAG: flagellar filament capping protein FliD, partial [Methylococcaceae bacterium]